MKFWKKLKYWQKGALIGFLVSILLPILAFTSFEQFDIGFDLIRILYAAPFAISIFLLSAANCGWCVYENMILGFTWGVVQFVLVGALIGRSYGEIKNQKKVRRTK